MIPLHLRLKNFLSYRHLSLDLQGLHTACICGANGAGKSSLLEAITWALWGECRTASEDDILYVGTKEVQVNLTFASSGQTYRVIRSRSRGNATALELQLQQGEQFKSLTEKGLRATQQALISCLKMDYETFIHSAYLRQGKADEFMLKRPTERKQILAEILNLGAYEQIAERAKEVSRSCKIEINLLEKQITELRSRNHEISVIESMIASLEQELNALQLTEGKIRQNLKDLATEAQNHQHLQQQLQWQQQQAAQLNEACQQLHTQANKQQAQVLRLEVLLQEKPKILAGYEHHQQICAQEAALNYQAQKHQALLHQHHELSRQIEAVRSELKAQIRHQQEQYQQQQQQYHILQQTLHKLPEVEQALAKLHQARFGLQNYDVLEKEAAPLLQKQQQLQHKWDRATAQIAAKLEELTTQAQQWQNQPSLEALALKIQNLDQRIHDLEQRKRLYQQVHQQGLERKQALSAMQKQYQELIENLTQLQQNHEQWHQQLSVNTPCPLCAQPLAADHWHYIEQQQRSKLEEQQAKITPLESQIVLLEREIMLLRQEYRQLRDEITTLDHLLEQRGSLHVRWEVMHQQAQNLATLHREIANLEAKLQHHDYELSIKQELHLLTENLIQLNYDERTHALLRGEVERWRWSEIKHSELKSAQKQAFNLAEQMPQLELKIRKHQEQLDQGAFAPEFHHQLQLCDMAILELHYDLAHHEAIRHQKEVTTTALLHYQELKLAEQEYPQQQRQAQEMWDLLRQRQEQLQQIMAQVAALQGQLAGLPPPEMFIREQEALQTELQHTRALMDQTLAELGSQRQMKHQINLDQLRCEQLTQDLAKVRHRLFLHQELGQAFGKNGIQSLLLETILPQIEIEANHILAQLSAHQLTVRFITQKTTKKGDTIETLEIEIADHQGTRAYETYSGGEAFRINFGIRLALSRVLAQRKGSTLQTLIIDEGFGSQDHHGCERLVAAVNAIAASFECILIITHMPQLKESFHVLIEVNKTAQGSVARIVN
jgi:exonuclease SbcC